jgi:ubiquinone/menaquinone biosynthesis C-methylase UbiE
MIDNQIRFKMQNLLEKWSNLYDRVQQKHIQSVYDYEVFNNILYEDLEIFIKLIHRNDNILDFGCGRGLMTYIISNLGYSIEGLELKEPGEDEVRSRNVISYRKKLELWKVLKTGPNSDKISFRLYSGNKLPYKTESMDSVFAYAVLEHVDDIQSSVREINRVLKKDGILYISRTPNKYSYIELISKFLGYITHQNKYSINELSNILEDNGFYVKQIEYIDFFPSNVPVINNIYQNANEIIFGFEKILRHTLLKYAAHHIRVIAIKK